MAGMWESGQGLDDAFMKRHPELAIRKPEATSIGRMAAFNRHNVNQFYGNVRRVLVDLKLEPHQIWNCDETGVTTVQVPEWVIAGRGDRQVAAVTSAERGTLVTMCNAVDACGAAQWIITYLARRAACANSWYYYSINKDHVTIVFILELRHCFIDMI